MCSAIKWLFTTPILIIGLLQLTDAAFLRCYNGSLDNYVVTPLSRPLAILSCINKELPTKCYTFGYRGKVAGPATTTVLQAYITKAKSNVLLMDWEQEAQSGFLGIPLGYALSAVPNAMKVGRELGSALIELTNAGVNLTDVHLVAHSLGAHVMGFAGRRTRELGYQVSRITGLDPAGALFDGTFAVYNGLDRTCAQFVDIVHTDPSGYGTNSSTGTVDIWPNYTGQSGTQPGCPQGTFESFSPEDLCSHDRSWRYYAESLALPTAFPAAAATDYNEWVARNGETNQTIYIGDLTNTRAIGNFYLRTNSESLFGLGAEGMTPISTQARSRRDPILTRILKYL